MKISSTPKVNYEIPARRDFKNYKGNLSNKINEDKVSFGSLGGVLRDGTTSLFKFIEKKGFFVEFLIVDTCSLVIPRIWIGLNRDKDKTGQFNYKAGAEEAGREMTSGPSMNLIPMGLLYAVTKLKPASHMERNTLDALTNSMVKAVKDAKNPKLNKNLAEKIFDDAFASLELKNAGDLKTRFINILTEARKLKSNEFKNKVKEFEDLISEINNSSQEAPLYEKTLNLSLIDGSKTTVKAKDLIEDFKNYSKDIIEKLTKQDFAKKAGDACKQEAVKWLEAVKNYRFGIKLATAFASFFAVGTFLLYLPKLYQQGRVSPAQESAMRVKGGANENK